MVENQRTLYQDKVAEFREKFGIRHFLGIIGGANNDVSASGTEYQITLNGLTILEQKFGKLGIVCGGTKGGIPEFAYNLARQTNRHIVGVYPEEGKKYALSNLDLAIVVPSPIYGDVVWGSETPVLTSLLDTVFVIGGEWGTLIEISTIIKNQKYRVKNNLQPTKIIFLPSKDGIKQVISTALNLFPHSDDVFFPTSETEFCHTL